jgi:hypothetical protein
MAPASGNYHVGDSFSVLVNINTGGESINAGEGHITFDNTKLQVLDLGYTQSVFPLWTDVPSFSNSEGVINFVGGVSNPGYVGSAGTILNVTFKAKAEGSAWISFSSGSILANDGNSTNIGDNLKGAVFAITAPDPLVMSQKTEPVSLSTSDQSSSQSSNSITKANRPLNAPVITKWPRQLNEDDTLTIEGLGYPLTKISVLIQKDMEESISGHTFSGFDGKFRFTYAENMKAGNYTVWAKIVTGDGKESSLSDPAKITVIGAVFLRIAGITMYYDTIFVVLFSAILFLVLVLLYLWHEYDKKKKKREAEISEAEYVLHHSFDVLKESLCQYVDYLVNAKNPAEKKERVKEMKEKFGIKLTNIEEKIEKEIKDVRNVK